MLDHVLREFVTVIQDLMDRIALLKFVQMDVQDMEFVHLITSLVNVT